MAPTEPATWTQDSHLRGEGQREGEVRGEERGDGRERKELHQVAVSKLHLIYTGLSYPPSGAGRPSESSSIEGVSKASSKSVC